ncbi:hypothetical protein [Solilutibacter silvestris]|uniref:hypothetical protein n=1 Tax=Solilutibacter silvestris TaxID=1645665 RepID=UPI003D343711
MIKSSLLVLAMAIAAPSFASAEGIDCKLHYRLDGWSMVYSSATGSGTVDCSNKKSMPVRISAKALGASIGKWQIDKGTGRFTDVQNINDVLGTYAKAEVNAGLAKSGSLQVLTKGNVSLALAGKGEGVNLGVEVGGFTIEKIH